MIEWLQRLLDERVDRSLDPGLKRLLVRLIDECQQIYSEAANRSLLEFPNRLGASAGSFAEKMTDLYRGLLVKILISVAWVDRYWSDAEKEAAQLILQRTWGVALNSEKLGASLGHLAQKASTLKWTELLRPFTDIPELKKEFLPALISNINQMANLVAKVDAHVSAEELAQLDILHRTLANIQAGQTTQADQDRATQHSQELKLDEPMLDLIHSATSNSSVTPAGLTTQAELSTPAKLSEEQRQRFLDESMQELNNLIGMDSVKQDVKQLANFIKVQTARRKLNLPATEIALHAIFSGNPGTGKTTVARIVGKLLSGLGILEQGHTLEADRSVLVASYAGQTAPKTHECINKALHGVLFIDEAYSLTSSGDDAYGEEAVQVLLKRMEDDRERLVVVLAGYPEPMDSLIDSNPGLRSRFQRRFHFPDYTPEELVQIFDQQCRKYHYKLTKATANKLLKGFCDMQRSKSDNFGNGRTVRNLFEKSLQLMACRIVDSPQMTEALLTTLQPNDIQFENVS